MLFKYHTSPVNSWVDKINPLIPIMPIGRTAIQPTAGSDEYLEIASATKKQTQAIPKPPRAKVRFADSFFTVFIFIFLSFEERVRLTVSCCPFLLC